MIKVGSDFSGVGAFNQALQRLGIDYEEVFACDMDKYARQTFVHNYGEPKYYPENVYDREIPNESLDIYMTSPPCQAFSLAGKRKGEEDKRGVLFYNSHEFIKINKPRFFIFENVKGLLSDNNGKTFQRWIDYLGGKSVNGNLVLFPSEESAPYHVYYTVLNAKNYGIPQNRERVFIVGIRDDKDNQFTWPKEEFLTKRLKDVLESDVDEKYYLSDKMITFFNKHSEKMKSNGNGFTFSTKDLNSIGNTITNPGKNRMDDNFIQKGAIRGRNPDNPKSRIIGQETTQMLEINQNGTSNCLTTVQKDNVVIESINSNQSFLKNKLQNFLDKNGYIPELYNPYNNQELDCISPTLTTCADRTTNSSTVVYKKDYRIRKLTPRECFRLMDFPESFSWPVSDSQAYKQAGNSICVGVLAKIISKLKLY